MKGEYEQHFVRPSISNGRLVLALLRTLDWRAAAESRKKLQSRCQCRGHFGHFESLLAKFRPARIYFVVFDMRWVTDKKKMGPAEYLFIAGPNPNLSWTANTSRVLAHGAFANMACLVSSKPLISTMVKLSISLMMKIYGRCSSVNCM